ncbi:MAG TPA: DUF4259 domain-containing protein [Phototrophicaceae bacterium]|jgi:hypothetical protein|nr:DUF4259 domain-containing protein [Phototrophicaceae bacterium]
MGTWGPGNFDSDNACEYLDQLLDQLIQNIEKIMTELAGENPFYAMEEYGDQIMMPALDVVLTLSRHYDERPHLESKQIELWRDTYLDIYDRSIHPSGVKPDFDQLPEDDYSKQRRLIIMDTFNQLKAIALKREKL